MMETHVERIAQVSSAVIHGWHSNLIAKHQGEFFRGNPDGSWAQIGGGAARHHAPHVTSAPPAGP